MSNRPCGCRQGQGFSRRDVLKAGGVMAGVTLMMQAVSRTPAVAQEVGGAVRALHFDPAQTPCARYVPDLPEAARRELFEHAQATGGRVVEMERLRAYCRAQRHDHAEPAPLPTYEPERIEPIPRVEAPVRLRTPKFTGDD